MAGLLTSGTLSYLATRHEVNELFDAQLIETTRFIKGLTNHPATSADWFQLQLLLQDNRSDEPFLAHPYEKKLAVQIWSPAGELLVRSPYAPNQALAPLHKGFSVFEGRLHDWLVYTLWLDQNQNWLVVAERTDVRLELATRIQLSVVVGLLAGSILALWWLRRELHQGLQPVFQLSQAIKRRQGADLSSIELAITPTELNPVVSELNALFKRAVRASERERRFLADAAHELRTPLAAMRLQVQQALTQAGPSPALLPRLMASIERNQQVVEQLLLLARVDSDEVGFNPVMTALDELTREAAAHLIPMALSREIDIEVDAEPVHLAVESAFMVALIRNVLDNAVRHTPPNTTVSVRVRVLGQEAELAIRDQGRGLPESAIPRVTQRFEQDHGQADRGGAGLGLAIVQTIVNRHSGRLHLSNHPDGGLVVAIYLPLA